MAIQFVVTVSNYCPVHHHLHLPQATAQIIRTTDKKVVIVVFRGSERTNLVNGTTNAIAKKRIFINSRGILQNRVLRKTTFVCTQVSK